MLDTGQALDGVAADRVKAALVLGRRHLQRRLGHGLVQRAHELAPHRHGSRGYRDEAAQSGLVGQQDRVLHQLPAALGDASLQRREHLERRAAICGLSLRTLERSELGAKRGQQRGVVLVGRAELDLQERETVHEVVQVADDDTTNGTSERAQRQTEARARGTYVRRATKVISGAGAPAGAGAKNESRRRPTSFTGGHVSDLAAARAREAIFL